MLAHLDGVDPLARARAKCHAYVVRLGGTLLDALDVVQPERWDDWGDEPSCAINHVLDLVVVLQELAHLPACRQTQQLLQSRLGHLRHDLMRCRRGQAKTIGAHSLGDHCAMETTVRLFRRSAEGK